ncbi:MAG: hypothetical protein JNG88_09860 [Phycisphaerales bacterium]|nr:hypothetical protein [Phycisphaerales bacterium]
MKTRMLVMAMMALSGGMAFAQLEPTRRPRAAATATKPETLRMLDSIMHDVEYQEVPLESVVEALGNFTKANIIVRWQKLEDASVPRDKPISLKVKNLPLSYVLWLVMNEAGGSDVQLAYRASGNNIIISTQDDLGQEMITKVYDVTDLLVVVQRFDNAPQFDPSQALQGAQGGGGGGGGGGGNVFQTNQDNENEENNQNGGAAPGMEELVRLIQDTVEPDSWVANGGRGQITPWRSQIVIRNTILVHQKLNGYKLYED